MPLAIPPGYAHVGIQMRNAGDPDPWYVTFGVDITGLAGNTTGLGLHLAGIFWDAWHFTFSSDTSVAGAQLTIGQDGAESLRVFVANTGDDAGTGGDDRLPQNCALLVRKHTAFGGRRHLGRMFMPGMVAEDVVSPVGLITPTALATYTGYAEDFYARLLSDEGDIGQATPMVLLHSSGATPTPEPTVVTSVSVDNVISTQRRRLR